MLLKIFFSQSTIILIIFQGSDFMGKEVSFKNRDRLVQLGIAIATLRRIRGLSQEMLAEKAYMSRGQLARIESPNSAHNFTLEVLYNIADALGVTPEQLLTASVFSDDIINKK